MASARSIAGVGAIGFASLIDTSMISPIIASHALSLGADELLASVIAALYSMIAIPMSAIAGIVVDRIGRTRPLFLGLLVDAGLMMGYMYSPTPLHLLVFRALHAVSDSFVVPSALAAIGDAFRQSLGRTLAVFWTFVAVSIVMGSGSATALVLRYGFAGVYATVAAITAAVSLSALIAGPLTPQNAIDTEGRGRGQGISSFALPVATASLSMLALYLVIGGVIGALPSMLVKVGGMDERSAAAQIGVFMALSTGLSIPFFFASSWVSGKWRPNVALAFGLVAVSVSSALLQLGLHASWMRLTAAVVFSVALGFVFHASSHIATSLPRDVRGTASGILNASGLLGVAVGSPLSALISVSGLPTGPFGTMALIALPVIALAALGLRANVGEAPGPQPSR
ncbi:MAG: MFS transporter [Nitrososphaerota archaeon]